MNLFPKIERPLASPLTDDEKKELRRAIIALHENIDNLQVQINNAIVAKPGEAVPYNFKMQISRATYITKHCNLKTKRKKEVLKILKEVEKLEVELFCEMEALKNKIDQIMSGENKPASSAELVAVIEGDNILVAKYLKRYAESQCKKKNPSWQEFCETYSVKES